MFFHFYQFFSWRIESCSLICFISSQLANIGPQDVPRMFPSNVPRTSPKDPIWRSQGRLDMTSQGSPNLTSWGCPEMTSRGRPNLTFKGRPWEVDSGRPLEDLQSTQTFLNLIDWPNLKAFQRSRCIENPVKLLRWSIFCKIS